MANSGNTYPNLRFIGSFEQLGDPSVPSLRFFSTQQLSDGACAWVESKSSYYHFERYSAQADDNDKVVNGFNGGKWIQVTLLDAPVTPGDDNKVAFGHNGTLDYADNVLVLNPNGVQNGLALQLVRLAAVADPGTPADGYVYMWLDNVTGKVSLRNHAGTLYEITDIR